MTTMTRESLAPTTPAQFAAELRANVDAWYALPNTPATYAEFGVRNSATWDRIRNEGAVIENEVLRILREEPRESK